MKDYKGFLNKIQELAKEYPWTIKRWNGTEFVDITPKEEDDECPS